MKGHYKYLNVPIDLETKRALIMLIESGLDTLKNDLAPFAVSEESAKRDWEAVQLIGKNIVLKLTKSQEFDDAFLNPPITEETA
jgi:hypothetical protein